MKIITYKDNSTAIFEDTLSINYSNNPITAEYQVNDETILKGKITKTLLKGLEKNKKISKIT
jgi:hypothetical protein